MTTVKQNFLVFRGTRKEVDNVESIDRCIYFAWDTGEIFVGNAFGSKTPYGGSNRSLSDHDIIQKIEEIFQKSYMEQLSINNSNISSMKDRLDMFEFKFNEMNEETQKYIHDQIEEVLSNVENLTEVFVSRKEFSDTLDEYSKATEVDTKLQSYIKTTDASKSFLTPMSGADIAKNISIDGYYLCTSDFINAADERFSFYKGTTYQILKGSIEEIASSGSGSGGAVSREFSISKFTVGNKTGTIVWEYGTTFSNPSKLAIVTNFKYGAKASSIVLKYNGVEVPTSEPISKEEGDHTVYVDFSTLNLNIGRNKFTLSALTVDGKNITSSVYFDIVRPIYYGSYGEKIFEYTDADATIDENGNTIITGNVINYFSELNKLTAIKNPTKKYTFTLTQEKPYAWICIPIIEKDAMNITKWFENFDVPYITIESQELKYRCYRSAEAWPPGSMTLDVTGVGSSYN